MTPSTGGFPGRWLAAGIDLLFPPRCLLCRREGDPWGAPVDPEALPQGIASGFCPACLVALGGDGERCLRCGEPADAAGCRTCRGRRPDHDGIVVLGRYEGDLREAVLRAKRPAGREIAAGLGRLLHARHGATIAAWGVDTVVPVPMHWRRRLIRGGSAADVVAAAIARAAGLADCGALRRRRATVMQNRLPFAARRTALRDAFVARPTSVRGRRVLLVDDVTTSGGTVVACRGALVDAGAAAVFVAVIARADHGGDDDASAPERPAV